MWVVVRQDQLAGGISRGGEQALAKKETGEKGVQKSHETSFLNEWIRASAGACGAPKLMPREGVGFVAREEKDGVESGAVAGRQGDPELSDRRFPAGDQDHTCSKWKGCASQELPLAPSQDSKQSKEPGDVAGQITRRLVNE